MNPPFHSAAAPGRARRFAFLVGLALGLLCCWSPTLALAQTSQTTPRRLAPVLWPNEKGKVGYVDQNRKLVIPAQFEDGQEFCEGLAAVRLGGKWGYIDERGQQVIAPRFDRAGYFSEGLAPFGARLGSADVQTTAPAAEDGPWRIGFIDRQGQVVIKPQFVAVRAFMDGYAAVSLPREKVVDEQGRSVDHPHAFVDRAGRLHHQTRHAMAMWFSEGLAPMLDEKNYQQQLKTGRYHYGYLDREFKWAIAPRFTHVEAFHEGFALAYLGGKSGGEKDGLGGGEWVCLNRRGEVAFKTVGQTKVQWVPAELEEASFPWFASVDDGPGMRPFSEGLGRVKLGREWAYLDTQGKVALRLGKELGQVTMAGHFTQGLAPVRANGKVGFIDKTGRWVIAPNYESATNFCSDGYAEFQRVTDSPAGRNAVSRMDRRQMDWGFLDRTGREIPWTSPGGLELFQLTNFDRGIGLLRALSNDHGASTYYANRKLELLGPVKNPRLYWRTTWWQIVD